MKAAALLGDARAVQWLNHQRDLLKARRARIAAAARNGEPWALRQLQARDACNRAQTAKRTAHLAELKRAADHGSRTAQQELEAIRAYHTDRAQERARRHALQAVPLDAEARARRLAMRRASAAARAHVLNAARAAGDPAALARATKEKERRHASATRYRQRRKAAAAAGDPKALAQAAAAVRYAAVWHATVARPKRLALYAQASSGDPEASQRLAALRSLERTRGRTAYREKCRRAAAGDPAATAWLERHRARCRRATATQEANRRAHTRRHEQVSCMLAARHLADLSAAIAKARQA